MMGLMGTPQQPLDFTMATDCQTVLDLRKVKGENDHYNQESVIQTLDYQRTTSPNFSCYPTTTTILNHQHIHHYQNHLQHRESSEDGSERGSISPPSVSPPTSITSPFLVTSSIISGSINRNGKPTRPFKAYPKDPLSLPVVSTAEAILGHASNEAYAEFRRRMLSQVQAVTNNNSTNSKMKRSVSPNQQPTSCSDQEGKDAAYWERRRKNNEAAKRSRDARRAKEDEIAIRAAFLEQENIQLKYENATLRNEAAKLRCLLYNR
ncbi:protein giant-like isoform X3 [Lycorma delicatula]|uniref:protein giant-like isoform X3 n=1 Tax=Lycorma delicatula TaxID=130591 RepID=UPI003F51393A